MEYMQMISKSLGLIIVLTISIFIFTINANATTLISENFNDQSYSSPLTLYNTGYGYDTNIQYSSSIRHGSTGYSIHVNHSNSGDVSANLSGAENYHSGGVYYRYWVYYPSSYYWCVQAGGTQGNNKIFKMAGAPGWDLEIIWKDYGSVPTQIQSFWNTSSGGTVSHYAPITNDYAGHNYLSYNIWHKVEIYMQIPNAIHVSVDDTTVYQNTSADIRGPSSSWTGTRQFSSIRALGGCIDPPSGHGDWYYDDITVVYNEGDLSNSEPAEPGGGTGDTTSPTVTGFVIPSTSTSLTIPVTTFTASDNTAVTGYLITESSSTPSISDSNWSGSAWTSYTVSTEGGKILYAWARDAAGNISNYAVDSCVVNLPEPGGDCTHYVATNGSDNNSGTSTGSPWRTINHAAAVVPAGSVTCIRSGTYAEDVYISSSRDGTAANPITMRNYPGESPLLISGDNITGMAFWVSADYWKFYGLNFSRQTVCGNTNTWSIGLFGSHNEVSNCTFEGAVDPTTIANSPCRAKEMGIALHGGDYNYVHDSIFQNLSFDGITVFDNGSNQAKYWRIVNNTFTNYVANGVDAASAIFEPMHGLIEGNTFQGSDTSDGVQFNNGAYVTNGDPNTWNIRIRNNIFKCYGSKCIAENCIDLKGSRYIVIENNIMQGGTGDNDGDLRDGVNDRTGGYGGTATGSGAPSQDIIIRGNIIYDNDGGSVAQNGYRIYNNTYVNNRHDYTGSNSSGVTASGVSMAWFGDVKVVNNIIGDSQTCDTTSRTIYSSNYINYNLYANDIRTPHMCAFSEESGAVMTLSQWQTFCNSAAISGKDANSILGDPDFTGATSGVYGTSYTPEDFQIGASSAAINAGGALTTTTNSGSNSTTLTVGDAKFFDPGNSTIGVVGDTIQIGGDATATISAISGNTIYLTSGATWSSGEGVVWCKYGQCPSDGQIDIGAWQYDGTTPTPTLSGGSPSGILPGTTTFATLSVTTSSAATVKYSIVPGTAYASMTSFANTGGTTHTQIISGYLPGNTYTYYVKAYAGDEDYIITFSINASTQYNLLNDQTYSSDSGDFDTIYPVGHQWDNDITDAGIAGGAVADLWTEFDLGATYQLSTAKIFGDDYGNWTANTWTLKYKLQSGDAWTDAFTNQDCYDYAWFAEDLCSVSCPTARYIRIEVDGNANYPGTQIYELQLFGDIVSEPPTISVFSMPSTYNKLVVPLSFVASSSTELAGYYVSESDSTPASGDPGWTDTAPTTYTFSTSGVKTLYGWAKNDQGTVSAVSSTNTTITLINRRIKVVFTNKKARFNNRVFIIESGD
jgi:hypothetical protein